MHLLGTIVIFAQSWRYKPGQYIAGASGCGPPALPYKGLSNGPSSSSAPFYPFFVTGRREQHQDSQSPQDDLGRPPPQTTSAPGTAHQAHPRTQAGPVILPADWEACAARRDGCDAAHPGGRFSLAGRA